MDPLTSYVFLSNATPTPNPFYTLPPSSQSPGKLLTFVDVASNASTYPWQIQNSNAQTLHTIVRNGGWASFVAGPTDWLLLGAQDSGQSFQLQTLQASTIEGPINALYTRAPSFVTNPTSSITTNLQGSIQSLIASTLTFAGSPLPLTVSSGLVYNGVKYGTNVTTEIVQNIAF